MFLPLVTHKKKKKKSSGNTYGVNSFRFTQSKRSWYKDRTKSSVQWLQEDPGKYPKRWGLCPSLGFLSLFLASCYTTSICTVPCSWPTFWHGLSHFMLTDTLRRSAIPLSIPFYNGRNWAHSADIIDHVPRAVKIHWWMDTVPTFGEAGREQRSQTGSDDMALDYEGSKQGQWPERGPAGADTWLLWDQVGPSPNTFLFNFFKRRSSNSNAFSIVRFQNLEPGQKRYFEQAMCGEVWTQRSHLAVTRLDVPPSRDQDQPPGHFWVGLSGNCSLLRRGRA